MATAVQDTIERRFVVKASKDKAWRSVTDPVEIVKWFCNKIEGTIAAGEDIVLIWGEHRARAKVAVFDPTDRFGYRWVPGGDHPDTAPTDSNSTLVLFTLREVEGGTEIEMVESGFSSLPESMQAGAFKDNNGGWDEELQKLVAYFA